MATGKCVDVCVCVSIVHGLRRPCLCALFACVCALLSSQIAADPIADRIVGVRSLIALSVAIADRIVGVRSLIALFVAIVDRMVGRSLIARSLCDH